MSSADDNDPTAFRPQVWTRKGSTARFGNDNVLRGLAAARSGEVISLNLRLDDPHVPFGRRPFSRHVRLHNDVRPIGPGRYIVINDDEITVSTQGGSQWDALAHFGLMQSGDDSVYFDGVTLSETHPHDHGQALGIGALGPGILARGVLLDLVGSQGGTDYLDGDVRIGAEELQQCIDRQQVTIHSGDALLLYTGYERRRTAFGGGFPADSAGLDASTVDLLDDLDLIALAADNPAIEAVPSDYSLHIGLLRGRGLAFGELWALDALASACRSEGRWDFLLASVPLNVPGAFGSTANAVAVR